jgi:hypothetical protein
MKIANKQEITEWVCSQIATSEQGLDKILGSQKGYPKMNVFLGWLRKDDELMELYQNAKQSQAVYMEGRILELSANVETAVLGIDGCPMMKKGKPITAKSSVGVAHATLEINTRKWLMERLAPKSYGSRQVLAGDPDAPLNAKPKANLDALSTEELAAFIKLQEKVEG